MSRQGAGHVQFNFLEPRTGPDKSDRDFAAEELGLTPTCLGWGPDMSGLGFWNPVKNPDKSGFQGILAWR
jgi:hypothetical protein